MSETTHKAEPAAAGKRPYEKPELSSITAQEILQQLGPARANYGAAGFTDDDTYLHDLRFSYLWDNSLTFFGGINNVTDEEPYISERAYPVSPVGRYAYLGVSYRRSP